MPIHERKDVEYAIHIHNGILPSPKTELENVIYSNMDGPRDYHIK